MPCSYTDYLLDLSLYDANDEMTSEVVLDSPIDAFNQSLFDLDLDFFEEPRWVQRHSNSKRQL